MKLTPLDIRHKEFKRGMRGYADVEVDEFLDEVADEFERVFKDNIDLGERVEALESQVSGYKRIEEALSLIHISEPTRLGMISYAVFCLKKKKKHTNMNNP